MKTFDSSNLAYLIHEFIVLKYQRSTTLDSIDKWIRKSEFVKKKKTQS